MFGINTVFAVQPLIGINALLHCMYLHVCFSFPQYRDPVTRGGGVVPLHSTHHSRCGTEVRSFYDKLQKLK